MLYIFVGACRETRIHFFLQLPKWFQTAINHQNHKTIKSICISVKILLNRVLNTQKCGLL